MTEKNQTFKCRNCGKTVTLIQGGGWTGMVNDRCYSDRPHRPDHDWKPVQKAAVR